MKRCLVFALLSVSALAQINNGGSGGSVSAPFQFGTDGVSSAGTFSLYPGPSVQLFTTNLNVVQHTTTQPNNNMGFAPLALQNVTDPTGTSDTNYYSAGAFYNVTPSANTQNIGTLSGIFVETKHDGSGGIGVGNANDNGMIGVDSEIFTAGSGGIGSHGARSILGVAGYLGSAASTGFMAAEELYFEIGNGSSGSLATAYGLAIDQPLNFAGNGTTTVSTYNALSIVCNSSTFITTFNCINIAGTQPNTLGTGQTSGGTFQATSNGTASSPSYTLGNGSHNFGWFASAAGVQGWSENATLGMELDFNWGLYLHDGDCIGFSSTATSLAKDTSVCRPAAGVVGIGSAANANDTTGKVKASGYISAGTKFTTNGGCGETSGTTTGGGTAGKFTTSGSSSCTSIVTFGDSATAPNGWACFAHDLTTSADYNNPRTSSTTTTLTIVTGTIVSGDVIEFGCVGY